jgi:hypothetical protein
MVSGYGDLHHICYNPSTESSRHSHGSSTYHIQDMWKLCVKVEHVHELNELHNVDNICF